MTKPLRFLLAAISFFIVQSSFSQVTLITPSGFKINGGLVLPNGHVVMTTRSHSGLYTTDGSSISLVTDSYVGNDLSTQVALQDAASGIYKGELYFTAFVADSIPKLYATDGTVAGTRFVAEINKTGNPDLNTLFKFNNLLYFIADDGVHGNELWSTDGTTANTKLVADINGDSSNSFPDPSPYYPYYTTQFFINGSYVLFTAYGADSTFGLYKLTASGISLVENNFADSTTLQFDTTGGKTFFIAASGTGPTASNQFWVTDGTNTNLLYNPGAGVTIYHPRFVNGKFVFIVTDTTKNVKLWSTDGTIANTTLFKDIPDYIRNYGEVVNNKLVFTVIADTSGNQELWSTDGTAANTQSIENIHAEIEPGYVINNRLLFTTFSDSTGNELWSTDGTAANTNPIKHIKAALYPNVVLNNKLIFSGYTSAAGDELWSTDGTAANTILLKDIVPGKEGSGPSFVYNTGALQNSITNGNSNFSYYTPFKGKYYFTANEELWSTDGTTDGTTLITNMDVQNNSSFFYTTTGIYFTEEDEDRTEFGLWVTDGTAAGTKKIEGYGGGNRKTYYQFVYNHQLYFTNYYYDTEGDSDLFKIDTTLNILPVGLSNFTASLQPSSVLLNWQTASEINTDHFVVERSVDGVRFNNIGNVAASGNSSTKHDYTLNDYSALHLGSSTLYYRLKTIDKDGKYTYSSIIKLQLHGGEFAYSLSPNPVRSQLTISFTTDNATKQVSLRITNANGKPVYEKSLQGLQPGSVQQYINVAGFAAGIYYIQLVTNNDIKTLKFVKQ